MELWLWVVARLMCVFFFFLLFLQKATKKSDKPRTEEVEVTDLADEDLRQQLAKHGVETGPIVGEFPAPKPRDEMNLFFSLLYIESEDSIHCLFSPTN